MTEERDMTMVALALRMPCDLASAVRKEGRALTGGPPDLWVWGKLELACVGDEITGPVPPVGGDRCSHWGVSYQVPAWLKREVQHRAVDAECPVGTWVIHALRLALGIEVIDNGR